MLADAMSSSTRDRALGHARVAGLHARAGEDAELIQGYFAAVGVNAKIVRHEWGVYLAKMGSGEHDMGMLGWLGGNADPDNFLYGLLSANTAKPSRPPTSPSGRTRSSHLCLKGQKTFNKAKRAKIYLQAQELFHKDVPWVPLAHTTIVRVYNKKIHDVPLRPNGLNSFQMVWKDK